MKKIKIGLVGCGAIGGGIAHAIKSKFSDKATLQAVCDADKDRVKALAKQLKHKLKSLDTNTLIKESDLIVEAANPTVSSLVVQKALEKGKNIMVLSSGGILKKYHRLQKLADKNKCRLYVASGALSGVDSLKATSFGHVKKITLTSRKPPKALLGAPYLREKNFNLKNLKKQVTIFQGSFKEATKAFPKNINVSATIALALLLKKDVTVRIITSPTFKVNSHELVVEGDFGRITTKVESKPSKLNPKTSQLAVLSAVATLRDILANVRIGT